MRTATLKMQCIVQRYLITGWAFVALLVWLSLGANSFAQSGGGTLDPITAFKSWEHTTVLHLSKWNPHVDHGKEDWRQRRVRLIGYVDSVSSTGPEKEDQYTLMGPSGGAFDVRCSPHPPMVNDYVNV